MKLSTSTNTLSNIKQGFSSSTTSTFKDFKELNIAIWRNPQIVERIVHAANGTKPQSILRQYTLSQASRLLGRSEEAFRIFLWENGIQADGEVNGKPFYSEALLDLIESHGYLFEYSKKWRQIGHHDEAERLHAEARRVFGESLLGDESMTERDSIPSAQQFTQDWVAITEPVDAAGISI